MSEQDSSTRRTASPFAQWQAFCPEHKDWKPSTHPKIDDAMKDAHEHDIKYHQGVITASYKNLTAELVKK